MDLNNEFAVPLPIDRAWELLTDVERIAPCMPGAQLTGVEGDTYTGKVLIKLGPVTAQYAGTAAFESKDDVTHVAVLRASGRDSRGQGNASALITATLEPQGEQTKVTVHTDLTITGKVAQFGRGVILDVSAKLLNQFVQCLESSLIAETAPATEMAAETAAAVGAPVTSTPAATTVRDAKPVEVAPLNLASVARGAVLKRAIPAVIALAAIIALIVWLARR
ncbi:MAG TPA: SRPBCC family protein [Acidothermaceae bacterium]|nr:SRPBCC family protein [Acidothermaceae bacterium]